MNKPPTGKIVDHPFKTLLKDANFLKLWVSQALSQLTIQLVNFMILTRVFEVTQSTVAVSLLWIAYSLPALFFAPFSGAVVDRFSRRKMMTVTNLLQAITVLLYLWVPAGSIFLLYVLVFAYSFLDQLYLPSQQASIPSIVENKLLPSANGIFLLTQQASLLVGFGLGGVFLALLGRSYTIMLAGGLLGIAAIAVYLLPRDWSKSARQKVGLENYLDDFVLGYEFIRKNRSVLYPLLLIAFTQIFITVIAVVLPTYTHQVLGLDLSYASFAFIVPGATGALILTYLLPRFIRHRRKITIIEIGFLVAAVSLGVLALLSHLGPWKLPLAVLIALGLGIAVASIMVPAQTLLQEKTPTWFRGRVYSSLNFLLIIGTTIPLLISAVISDLLGVATMIGAMAILLVILLIFMFREGDHVLAHGFGL